MYGDLESRTYYQLPDKKGFAMDDPYTVEKLRKRPFQLCPQTEVSPSADDTVDHQSQVSVLMSRTIDVYRVEVWPTFDRRSIISKKPYYSYVNFQFYYYASLRSRSRGTITTIPVKKLRTHNNP